jgi:D-amino-acid oxidase
MPIEPHLYLRALLQQFHNVAEVTTLPEPGVLNCTELGARALFSDRELIPIKGQLTYLLPQPEVNYVLLAGDLYMFRGRDGIVLGGAHVAGDWTLEPDLVAKSRILAGHASLSLAGYKRLINQKHSSSR